MFPIKNYLTTIANNILSIDENLLNQTLSKINNVQQKQKKIIIVGNGGSAAIASHISVDLTKNAHIRATNFNEADLITCLANDYGYEKWLAKAIELYADSGDLLVAISSSGQSKNIINATKQAKIMQMPVITFSGFSKDNPLRKEGVLNFWVDSRGYNVVEMTHYVWLATIVDSLIGKIEYSAQ